MIHVAVGVIVAADGRVLLAKRPDGVHQGGLWEFPGGKLEDGEDPAAGLRRELHEELGIGVRAHRPLLRVCHRYPDKQVLLDVYTVTDFTGEPHGREGQPLVWVAPTELGDYSMPVADRPIVAALRLPATYVFSPPDISRGAAPFLQQLAALLETGVAMVQLRVFGLEPTLMEDLAQRFVGVCRRFDALAIINSDRELALRVGADGVHLNARQLQALACRPEGLSWVGASCHSQKELIKACDSGIDFAVLSPVLPTPSHPDAQPLGWEVFRDWVDGLPLPVYALGGMRPEFQTLAWHMGAQGIAGIRGFWQDADGVKTARANKA